MAEFVQMMKDWRRMCMGRRCDNCDLYRNCNIDPDSRTDADIRRIDTKVKIWAAEHPEPVYPSIAKYLEQFGITIHRDGTLQTDFFKAHEPMSADTAEKLGLQPKK